MSKRWKFVVLVIAVLVVPIRSNAEIRVGAACEIITPPEGTYLAGYGHDRKSTGVHDDLYAKSVVFDDGKTPLALVVLDCIGLQYPTVQKVRGEVSAKCRTLDLPADRIVIVSTHTHAGPDVIGIYGPDFSTSGYDERYIDQLIEQTSLSVMKAVENLRPAKLVFAETECKDWAVNDSEPGEVDHSVTVLQCLDAAGDSIATLTNFACHPTVLDGNNTLVSADYVGFFYQEMGESLPGEHLFLQGAIGGWIQPKTPERTFALAEKYGTDLAEKTLSALRTPISLDETGIRFDNKTFDVTVENELLESFSKSGIIQREFKKNIECEVVWFAVGLAQFATHPGETAPAYSFATERLMDTGPKFVLGLGLDEIGYILKDSYFGDSDIPHSKYLSSMSPGISTGPSMMSALESVIP